MFSTNAFVNGRVTSVGGRRSLLLFFENRRKKSALILEKMPCLKASMG